MNVLRARSPEREWRAGILWIVAGVVVLAAMLAMWWLVARTNSEGDHDAELLPFFSLIPLLIGGFHLWRARHRMESEPR
jgi:hypothetical protein